MGYFQLGKAYQKGTGVQVDLEKAKEYLKKSADMGYVNAINTLKQLDNQQDSSPKATTSSSGVAYQAPEVAKKTQASSQKGSIRYSNKSKTIAILLAIFTGLVGGQNWYLGYTKKATIQLILSVTSLSLIWGFIDAYKIATGSIDTDAKGGKLQ